jgi:hypothetical protein
MDYQSNSKNKKELAEVVPDKKIEKVVKGDVVVHKKSLGRRFKDIFIEADLRSVTRYIASEVLIPAFRNMVVDGASKGVERMMYGDTAVRRRNYGHLGSRITYNNPINRGYRNAPPSRAPMGVVGASSRASHDDFVLESREEADLVIERMSDILDTYEVVSVADLNELVGFQSSHVDNKWGWFHLGNVHVRQIREGYLIDLPPAEPIS